MIAAPENAAPELEVGQADGGGMKMGDENEMTEMPAPFGYRLRIIQRELKAVAYREPSLNLDYQTMHIHLATMPIIGKERPPILTDYRALPVLL